VDYINQQSGIMTESGDNDVTNVLESNCTSDSEKLLQEEITSMYKTASQPAVENLLIYLRNSTGHTNPNMCTAFVNFLERSKCPEGENSCLNLHIHSMVYLLNSRQLLIGNTSTAEDSQVLPSSSENSSKQVHGETLSEVDDFLTEMKELGL
jgi:hypothetical protein